MDNAIETRYKALLASAKQHIPNLEVVKVDDAFKFIEKFFADKKSYNGELYIVHLLEVAQICVEEVGLEQTSLVAALLHATIEVGAATKEEIEQQFGRDVAQIVETYAKISAIDPKNTKNQAELYRQMLISISNDARVILIKLADRLAKMRNLGHADKNFQIQYSNETFSVWASLAHRLGLYNLKSELEDLAMRYIYPKEYNHIVQKLSDTTEERNRFIASFIAPIEKELKERGFKFDMKGRTKSIYSIFRKMQKQNAEFEDVFDIFAIRIILDSEPAREKSDCWQVYSIITDKYTPNPERLRDWISVPKSNGYESLHTTVVNPDGKWVEVQIRTTRMDDVAERGLAAHWKYKGIKNEKGIDGWIERVREILESNDVAPADKVTQFQVDLKDKDIYVFTPKGEIRKLPKNSTVLDFAFDIHTRIGSQCVGAKVNNRNVPIKYELQNGDVVDVTTSKKQFPKKDWLSIVVTSKAKTRIKQELRNIENKEISDGREIFLRRLKNWKIDNPDGAVNVLNKHLKLKKANDIFILIAEGKVDLSALKSIIMSAQQTPADVDERPLLVEKSPVKPDESSDDFLVIDEKLLNIDYKLAKCCNPIFGDDIFGFVTVSDGIKIHRDTCPNAGQLERRWGYRIVKAKWRGVSKAGAFQTSIKIIGNDEVGILNRISEVISKDLKVNMRNISVSSNNGQFEGTIQLYVEDTKHLEMLLYRLNQVKGVSRAIRLK